MTPILLNELEWNVVDPVKGFESWTYSVFVHAWLRKRTTPRAKAHKGLNKSTIIVAERVTLPKENQYPSPGNGNDETEGVAVYVTQQTENPNPCGTSVPSPGLRDAGSEACAAPLHILLGCVIQSDTPLSCCEMSSSRFLSTAALRMLR